MTRDEARTTTAIVLAGGASSRFGGDKLAFELDGRPLLHHALEAVSRVADRILVVIGPEGAEPSLPPSASIAVVRDPFAHRGPLAGLASGLDAMEAPERDDPRRIALVVGGDMPWLEPAVLALLVELVATDPGLGAGTLETDPPAALPLAVRPSLAAPAVAELLREDRRALRGLLARVPSAVVPAQAWRALDPDGRTLRDVDTRDDLAAR